MLGFVVETLYVCDLPEQALALAAETGVRNAAVEPVEAERDRGADAIDAVVERRRATWPLSACRRTTPTRAIRARLGRPRV